MKNISVIVGVYNEEKRIERFLKSFGVFDEIIVNDKSSTDNTAAICLKYGAKVNNLPYSDRGDLGKDAVKVARNEWVLIVTASDVIHPDLPKILIDLINADNFSAEVVYVPYIVHVHGINSKYVIGDTSYRPWLCKKNVLVFQDIVHEENSFNTKNVFYLPKNRKVAIHHLSHQNMESTFERYLRYSKLEIKKNRSLYSWLRYIIRAFATGIRKRFWKLGWDGLALLLMLILYRIMIFLWAWEKKRGIDVEAYYDEFAKKLYDQST